MNTYEQKIAAKKERLLELAEKNKQESKMHYDTAHKMSGVIPFGQPVLVGHHSEKGDRNYRNRIQSNFDKSIEADKKARHYEEKAESVGTGGISSDDPEAAVKLKEKLANLEKIQSLFKSINKAIKQNNHEALIALGLGESRIVELKTPDQFGRVGIPSYKLTNNSATIRATKQRIALLEKTKNDVTTTEIIGNIEIINNVEENRLQVFFPSIPDEETRKKLKQGGFRWSPTNGCWQRHRGTGARGSLNYILKLEIEKEQNNVI